MAHSEEAKRLEEAAGTEYKVSYLPAESDTVCFGVTRTGVVQSEGPWVK